MVLLGGLEIVAAGYVLNELSKDSKAAQRSSSSQPHKHRRKHRDSSPSRPRPPRPSRPSQQNLMPPQPMGPPRPTSAPPQQFGPPRMNSAPVQSQGPPPPGAHPSSAWMNPNQPFSQPNHPQTWSQPQSQQHAYHQPQPQQHPSAPNNSAYAGTVNNSAPMYFDTKTGKWQSGMLPPEMPRTNSTPATRDLGEGNSRRREKSRRQRSYSSGSGSYSSESGESDLAYGNMPGHRPNSHVRERPTAPPPYSEREHDWYSNQHVNQSQPALAREHRSATVSAAELSGASAPRPGHFELDAETPGRYRSYGKN